MYQWHDFSETNNCFTMDERSHNRETSDYVLSAVLGVLRPMLAGEGRAVLAEGCLHEYRHR